MTVNFTGDLRRGRYLIYGRDRFVVGLEYARRIVDDAGLTPTGSVFFDAIEPAGLG